MNKYIKIAAAAAAGAAGFLGGAFFSSEKLIKTTGYTLDTGKDGKKITAAVLSDLHFSKFGKDNKFLISAVKKINPDFIIVSGDFFDFHGGRSNKELVLKTLDELLKIADVYFAPGNHDKRYNEITGENCLKYASEAGCIVLDGSYTDTQIKGRKVRIGGIFDHSVYLEDYGERWHKSEVYSFLKDFQETEDLKLLIMHRPNTFIYTKDKWDIDAVFCGHDHGGIWRIPFIGGVYAPEQGIFPEYDRGEYSFGKMKMFLSSGLEGYYIVPRLFNPPEILKIDIK